MLITVNDESISIAGHRFTYGIYYFDEDEYKDLRPASVMVKVLDQWRRALIDNPGEGRVFFLPFELDDECVECIMATSQGDMLALQYVWAAENGYSVITNDLTSFILAPHEIQRDFGELGRYNRDEFLSALIAPQVHSE